MNKIILTLFISVFICNTQVFAITSNNYKKGEELLQELKKLEPRFEKIYQNWERDVSDERREYPKTVDEKYKKSGIVPYNRNYILYTYERSIPTPEEVNKEFSVEMALGEYEPLSISLWALDDIHDLKIKAGEFKNKNGDKFSSNSIDIYNVISIPIAYSRKYLNRETEAMKKHIYEIQPAFLVKLKSAPVRKNNSLQILLDFKSTSETVPGVYKGSIAVQADDREAYEIPITLTVNVFVLDDVPHWQRGLFQKGLPSVEVLKLQKEWGFNSIAFWWFNGGHFYFGNARKGKVQFKGDTDGIGYHLENMRKAGFGSSWVYFLMHKGFSSAVGNWTNTKYPSEEYREQYISALRELFDYCRENNYPLPILVPTDEPTKNDLKRFLTEASWISEAFNSAKIYTVLFQKDDTKIFQGKKYLNLWVSNNPDPAKKKAAEENGSEFGIYRGVHIKRPIADIRFQYGLKSFWFGAEYTYGWANNFIRENDPFFDFIGGEGFGHSVIYEMPSGPIPTLNLLALREAIDDRRYVETLIKKKGESVRPFLNYLKKKIYSRMVPEGQYAPKDLPDWVDPWTYGQIVQNQNPVFMDKWRREIVKELLGN